MNNKYWLMLLLIVTVACKQRPKPQKPSITYLNTTWKDSSFRVENYNDSFPLQEQQFEKGKLFFEIDSQHFLITKDDSSSIFLYQKKEDQWEKQFELDCNFGLDLFDFNKDGYPDLSDDNRRERRVFLYNPIKKKIVENDFWMSWETDVVDSVRKVFCEKVIHISTSLYSSLFKIENYTFKILYSCEIERGAEDSIGVFKLYATKSNYRYEENKKIVFRTETILDNYELDHIKFWQDFYYKKKYTLQKLPEN